MAIEIERKFLVTGDGWKERASPGQRFCQGYLARTPRGSMRVRRAGDGATVTVKGRRRGLARTEFEYPVPVDDAEDMLRDLCSKPLIEKVRYEVVEGGHTWEVDVYCGSAQGLVLAELELASADEPIAPPTWIGREVTFDLRYRNSAIVSGDWLKGLTRDSP